MSGSRVVLSPKAAGEYLGLAAQTLARWRVEGKGPVHIKVGAKVLYDRADLDAWLDGQKRRSTSDKGEAA